MPTVTYGLKAVLSSSLLSRSAISWPLMRNTIFRYTHVTVEPPVTTDRFAMDEMRRICAFLPPGRTQSTTRARVSIVGFEQRTLAPVLEL